MTMILKPTYRLPQPDPTEVVVVDLSTPALHEDFAFTIAGMTPRPQPIVGHHTIEHVIFSTALAQVLTQRPRVALQQLRNVPYAVNALADDAAPVRRCERAWSGPNVLDPSTDQHRPEIVLDEGTGSWSVRVDKMGLRFQPSGDETPGFIWPRDALWKLLSALIWRTHRVDQGRTLSRVPTDIYADTITAAIANLEPAAAAEPRSPGEAAEKARYAAMADWYENDGSPVASAERVLRGGCCSTRTNSHRRHVANRRPEASVTDPVKSRTQDNCGIG